MTKLTIIGAGNEPLERSNEYASFYNGWCCQ